MTDSQTVEERAETGRSARAALPRRSHAEIAPESGRDPIGLLEAQATSRVPELVPIRYGRMLVSPFTFFRGAAAVMAHDLAATAPDIARRAALRRCPPCQLRRLRVARAAARLRSERLRRDAPRPVRVGREAARDELRGGGPRAWVLGHAAAGRDAHGGRQLPRGHAAVRDDAEPRRLVRTPRRRGGRVAARRARRRQGVTRADAIGGRSRPDQGQHARARQADAGCRRVATDHLEPAADRADRGAPRPSTSDTPSRPG